MIPDQTIKQLIARHEALEAEMANPNQSSAESFVSRSREYAELTPVVESLRELLRLRKEADELAELIADPDSDAEMRALVEDELRDNKLLIAKIERRLRILLLPKDAADKKNAILEVRAGTGGDEAALFAATLFRMYQRYAELRGWKFELMGVSESSLGGYREATASISGAGAYARLKFESGVHRVQRVPETESSGRVHTSAATVAILPEAEEVDVQIDDKDLRIDVFRASGPGGQSVNTTDSAVRITHIPTGLVVQQQDEKSQHKNRAKALKVLRARLYEAERQKQADERAEARRGMVGTGDRSERVRTYNFPQNRITDHRINLTLYKLEQVLSGEALDEIVDQLITEDQARRLAAMEGSET